MTEKSRFHLKTLLAASLPMAAGFDAMAQPTASQLEAAAFTEINADAGREETADAESHTNGLIADLAWVLLLGAVVTLLFKKLKQPVVLGYILAGFLASPKFVYLPSISNLENIDFWADLGIVVLMFTLGLEFSFKKLLRSGSSAIVTALIIITGMVLAGFGVGKLLDMNFINCIFLGGMISMSSTTIILKALTDLGLKQKKFASLVLAVLIIEDLFAVLMLVLLSSLAMGNVEGSELLYSVGKLAFFLIIWFVVGVYLLPSGLNRLRSYLNEETLLIVSMGLCFSMAVFSVICGFSLELGAFVMGSILAGTMAAERMEKVVQPVKNLFGAVFFISVGMMVDPGVLTTYWSEILLLAAVVIAGMIVFGTLGMLVTGQTLRVAIESLHTDADRRILFHHSLARHGARCASGVPLSDYRGGVGDYHLHYAVFHKVCRSGLWFCGPASSQRSGFPDFTLFEAGDRCQRGPQRMEGRSGPQRLAHASVFGDTGCYNAHKPDAALSAAYCIHPGMGASHSHLCHASGYAPVSRRVVFQFSVG
jgi:Kef-type K+ transport system membrane component KefB